MEFRILGHLEALECGEAVGLGGGKQRALLAILLLSAGRVVSVERLLAELWGEELPDSATKMVQIHVSQLRKALPDGLILTRAPGYQLRLDGHELDLLRFEAGCADGRVALGRGDAATAADLLADALALWRGPALAEFGEPFAAVEAARLEEMRLACQEERIEADLALGRHAAVAPELEALAARHPLRERPLRQLVLALYRCGRQADALAAYTAFRRRLDEQLGIDPSPALRELELGILRQDATLDPPAPLAPGPSPRALPPLRAGGRERELERLRAVLEEALAGRRQLVLVAGDAGIGKTRLIDAFAGSVTAAGAVAVARGQCVEHRGVGEAYLPVLDALGRLCRGPGGEEAVAVLAERAPAWLLQLPGLVPLEQLDEVQRRAVGTTRDRMLRELLEALDVLTAAEPLVLLLEDLHWSDVSTVDLLDALARRDEPARLLVVGTYRPADAAAAGHPLRGLVRELRARGRCSELAVGALAEAALAEIVADRFDGTPAPAELVSLLHRRTHGSPLFVERLLDAWLDEGHLSHEPGGLVLRTDPADLAAAVPDTIRELIEQLLERLAPDDRDLLEAASVAGSAFSAAAVAAASGRDADEVEARLDLLARQGALVERRGSEEWPDLTLASRYGFAHDLHREVLYDGLPAGRRTRLHARLGERLERAHAGREGEVAAELALHFVRGREPLRAARHLAAAAANALQRTAPREAVELLRTAEAMLAAAPPGQARDGIEIDVRLLLGPAVVGVEGWASSAAEQALLDARRLAVALGRDEDRARAEYQLGTMYEVRGEYTRSAELMRGRPGRARAAAGAGAADRLPRAAGLQPVPSGRVRTGPPRGRAGARRARRRDRHRANGRLRREPRGRVPYVGGPVALVPRLPGEGARACPPCRRAGRASGPRARAGDGAGALCGRPPVPARARGGARLGGGGARGGRRAWLHLPRGDGGDPARLGRHGARACRRGARDPRRDRGFACDGSADGRRLLPRAARRRARSPGPLGRGPRGRRRGSRRGRRSGSLLLRGGAAAAARCHPVLARRRGGRARDARPGARRGPGAGRALAGAARRARPAPARAGASRGGRTRSHAARRGRGRRRERGSARRRGGARGGRLSAALPRSA
ncbi:MAG: BTAD domain-containing putative transcriptional regulator [Thermoleophilia bacterium]